MPNGCHYNIGVLPSHWTPRPKDFPPGSKVPEFACYWSGKTNPPAIGDRVRINFNQLGYGIVDGYFTEYGWLGIYVKMDAPPDWWKRQNAGRPDQRAMVFGVEID